MMFGDEREETLREVAALGNIKAVHHFIHAGVNINSQNKMNGWTALHWAAHRGHELIIRQLLGNGADPNIKTNKGQTAYDLAATYDTIASLLKDAMGEVDTATLHPEPDLPVVPSYLKNPDLEKSWLHPEEFSENKLEKIVRQQAAVDAVQETAPVVTSSQPPTQKEHVSSTPLETEKEILVYLGSRSDENILGSIFLKNQTIDAVIDQMKEELDNVPSSFSIARHNGKMAIPINSKQMNKKLLDLFRSDDDVLVIIPSSSS
ncbi:uncharacterized protein BYT42DRAFT_12692 [Radiomyces spectabilis]|uniref:uncharacterized protein n=1 Tax=Radiomyces spectabilis TaxID=64574 RepID=UPI002220B9D0|nr:uncharacterized protein BYT42DRAFT_12692 [Radiomyces spectabilis]KAI8393598.1 hypothetical protein BYT42DRAFT_12692 [Radiomyces spectabilis]